MYKICFFYMFYCLSLFYFLCLSMLCKYLRFVFICIHSTRHSKTWNLNYRNSTRLYIWCKKLVHFSDIVFIRIWLLSLRTYLVKVTLYLNGTELSSITSENRNAFYPTMSAISVQRGKCDGNSQSYNSPPLCRLPRYHRLWCSIFTENSANS